MSDSIDITTRSPEDARRLGRHIGAQLPAGSVVTLTGDLGSGKTTIVQGLARGLGVPEDYRITSPTYTLINEYPGRHVLYHVDLYRLENADDMEEIGLYDLFGEDGVVAIEWADRLTDIGSLNRLHIHSEFADEASRRVRLSAHGIPVRDVLGAMSQRLGPSTTGRR